jgi:hypothetical protein
MLIEYRNFVRHYYLFDEFLNKNYSMDQYHYPINVSMTNLDNISKNDCIVLQIFVDDSKYHIDTFSE